MNSRDDDRRRHVEIMRAHADRYGAAPIKEYKKAYAALGVAWPGDAYIRERVPVADDPAGTGSLPSALSRVGIIAGWHATIGAGQVIAHRLNTAGRGLRNKHTLCDKRLFRAQEVTRVTPGLIICRTCQDRADRAPAHDGPPVPKPSMPPPTTPRNPARRPSETGSSKAPVNSAAARVARREAFRVSGLRRAHSDNPSDGRPR